MIKYIVVGALLGIPIGVLIVNFDLIDFDSSFHLDGIFTLFVTSAVGVYIADRIGDRQNSQRAEKDFITSEIVEFKSELAIIKSKNDIGNVDFEEAKRIFRDLNNDIRHLEELAIHSKFCTNIDFIELRRSFTGLRKTITDISPTNGVIIIPASDRLVADGFINGLKTHLYLTILKINK